MKTKSTFLVSLFLIFFLNAAGQSQCTLTCPGDITVGNYPGLCKEYVTIPDPTFSGDCQGSTLSWVLTGATTGAGVGSIGTHVFHLGVTTVEFSCEDSQGIIATCSMLVTVNDDESPTVASCPADITVNNDPGLCEAIVIFAIPSFDDNCDGEGIPGTMTGGLSPGSSFPLGTTTVTYEYTDAAGNGPAVCTFDITVSDMEPPTITCPPDVTVSNDPGLCEASGIALGVPVTSDNCGVAVVTSDAPGEFPVGAITVTWTVADNSGNTAYCTQTVTVVDIEPPYVYCSGDITVYNDPGQSYATITFPDPITHDNCPGTTTTQIAGLPSGSQFPLGVTINSYSATDMEGNSTTCSFTVTVNYAEYPTITCPPDTSIECLINLPSEFNTLEEFLAAGGNAYSDNGIKDFYLVGEMGYGYCPLYIERTYLIVDSLDLTAECVQTMTINDTIAPVISCPPGITSDCEVPLPYQSITQFIMAGGTVFDNCEIDTNTFTLYEELGYGHSIMYFERTYGITDMLGNISQCVHLITVIDSIHPIITCPPDTNVVAADTNYVWINVIPATANDNCAIDSVWNNYTDHSSAAAYYPVGETNINWYVVDSFKNTDSCQMKITVGSSDIGEINKSSLKVLVHPNPLSGSTTFEYEVTEPCNVSIYILNYLGHQIKVLVDQQQSAGTHRVEWKAEGLPPGVHFYRLQAGEQYVTGKIVLLR